MPNCKKNLIVIFSVIFLVFVLVDLSFAAERKLEVPIPGLETTTIPALPDYILAIYNFALMAIGIICFGALIYGGIRYLTSAGKPAAITDAKDQIFSALLGLILLFSSYLILSTINPELVILGEGIKPEDVILPVFDAGIKLFSDKNFGGEEQFFQMSIEDLGYFDFDNKASSVSSVDLTHEEEGGTVIDLTYGAVLHEHQNFEGRCGVIRGGIADLSVVGGYPGDIGENTASSIHVFPETETATSTGKVVLYEKAEYSGLAKPFRVNKYTEFTHFTTMEYTTGTPLDDNVGSIKIEGNYIAILFQDVNFGGECEVFRVSDRDLFDNPFSWICQPWWCPCCWLVGWEEQDYSSSSMIIIPIGAR